MRLALGSDHAGFELKGMLADHLREQGHDVVDLGTHSPESVDYPDIASLVAGQVSKGEVDRGILICGTGIGMCIAANKVHGVRAANCRDLVDAEMSRAHNDANVLCLSQVLPINRAVETERGFIVRSCGDQPFINEAAIDEVRHRASV